MPQADRWDDPKITVIGTILEFSSSFVTISLCGIQFTARISKHHRPVQMCHWPLPSEACLTPSLGTMTRRKSWAISRCPSLFGWNPSRSLTTTAPRNRRSKASQDTVAPRADLGLAGGRRGYRDPLENVLWFAYTFVLTIGDCAGFSGEAGLGARAVGVPGRPAAERPREGFSSFLCPSWR